LFTYRVEFPEPVSNPMTANSQQRLIVPSEFIERMCRVKEVIHGTPQVRGALS
jgi:hypothetical protein